MEEGPEMRRESALPALEGEMKESQAPQASPAALATASPKAAPGAGTLTAMMALEEPARTEALEKATNAGLTVYLQSTTGEDVRWRYGDHILVVPPTPKPFAAPHAVHLLFYAADRIEEVAG
jgi:hypothetical protein